MSDGTSFAGMFEAIGSSAAATTAGSTMAPSGATGVVDGGRTVSAHVGGSPLTDSMSGSAIELGSSTARRFSDRDLVSFDLGQSALSLLDGRVTFLTK